MNSIPSFGIVVDEIVFSPNRYISFESESMQDEQFPQHRAFPQCNRLRRNTLTVTILT